MNLPNDLIAVLRDRAICFVTTLMPDGAPHVTQTWADTEDGLVVINTVSTHQKMRNLQRDPRIGLGIADPAQPGRSWGIRGEVVAMTTDGGDAHIDTLSNRYLGRDYPGVGGGQGERVVVAIRADTVTSPF
jgi:PPOX class probable F420-dependent enzyme